MAYDIDVVGEIHDEDPAACLFPRPTPARMRSAGEVTHSVGRRLVHEEVEQQTREPTESTVGDQPPRDNYIRPVASRKADREHNAGAVSGLHELHRGLQIV